MFRPLSSQHAGPARLLRVLDLDYSPWTRDRFLEDDSVKKIVDGDIRDALDWLASEETMLWLRETARAIHTAQIMRDAMRQAPLGARETVPPMALGAVQGGAPQGDITGLWGARAPVLLPMVWRCVTWIRPATREAIERAASNTERALKMSVVYLEQNIGRLSLEDGGFSLSVPVLHEDRGPAFPGGTLVEERFRCLD